MLICNGRLKGDADVGSFTYYDKKGKSTNDYALISKGLLSLRSEFHVDKPNVFSDHSPIVLNLCNLDLGQRIHNENDTCDNVNHPLKTSSFYKSINDDVSTFTNRMNDDFSCSQLNSILEITERTDTILDDETVEDCIKGLIHVLEYAAEPFKCTYKPNEHNCKSFYKNTEKYNKWYDSDCKNKKKEFDIARDLYYHTLHERDLRNMCDIRNSYRKLCRRKRKEFNLKNASELVTLSKKNSKLFWKKIKPKKKRNNANCNFHEHFKKLYETCMSDLSDESYTRIQEHNSHDNNISDAYLDSSLTEEEMEKAIRELKNDKSPGFDNIINEFLKYNTTLFRKTLLSVFNVLYDKGYFPKAWSIGLIIPVFKSGDANSADNYRGITLLSCVGKLFTSILNNRLNVWAEMNKKFDKNQYGFRANKSTIDAMFVLQNCVDIFLNNHNALYVCFIDLKKAFDSTNHDALWYKLHTVDVSSKMILLLKNMYMKMKMCVKDSLKYAPDSQCKCDNHLKTTCCMSCYSQPLESYFFYPHAGVFQGESLSPTLFSMFINDINDFMKSDPNTGISIYQLYLILLLFADDMVLFSDNRTGLQAGLNRLHEYCSHWGLVINVVKTKCLVFRNGGKKNALDKWYYNGEELETVTSFKYLGFVFSSSGKYRKGVDHIVSQGQKAFFNMKSTINNFDNMNPKMQISLFNSLVGSVLSYACELWGSQESKKVETLHLKFLKQILKVKKTTPNCIVYRECNIYPLHIARIIRIIKYWLKIIFLDESDPLKIIYQTSIDINNESNINKYSCWALTVKNILFKNGFGNVWVNQHMEINRNFFGDFKKRLIDSFWQSNNTNIESLSMHRLYRHLSAGSSFYLTALPNDFIRVAITKLRLGSHHLHIERGRWNNVEYNQRKCNLCNDIDDEYHFVMCCRKFHDIRMKYLPKYLYTNPSMFKFLNFLNCDNIKLVKKLGLFLHNAFKKYTNEEILA